MQRTRAFWALVAPGLALLFLLFVLPVGVLVRYSFYKYTPGQFMQPDWVLDSYIRFLADPFQRAVLYKTLWLGIVVVLFCTLLGYPVAYLLARKQFALRGLAAAAVVVPLLTSTVVTTFGWIVLLADTGLINKGLLGLGLIEEPLKLMFNERGVIIALVHSLLPYMILSIRASLFSLDRTLEEAAQTLGANPAITFLQVTLPLSLPGVAAGGLLVFVGTISAFVTPVLIGGGRIETLASVIYRETMVTLNWPLAAAASVVLLLVTVLLLWGYGRLMESRMLGGGGRT